MCGVRTDLAFIVDGSGSIKESNPSDQSYDNWDFMKTFLMAVLDRLGPIGPDHTQASIGS